MSAASSLDPPRENGAVRVLGQILRVQRLMTWLTVTLFVLLALFGGVVWTIRSGDVERINQIANTNQQALCAFRGDVQARVLTSVQFLEEHPNGIPGISPAVIREGLQAQRQTVEALAVLNCGG
jgi:hypothetical protein